ncbi:hypothetical protein HDK90DRAFT_491601 [Phyllosticta capitalensis]|uniref:Uncharacterized protein n=1 Tax=Phyllosticta capitalensis TaxID=121624 RepID=A0ABR1YIZ8_9PEZI
MSDQLKEIADVPKDFIKDGTLFINRCTKPDKREFIKISQAVGIGFVVMGAIGYLVKLGRPLPPSVNTQRHTNTASAVHIPVNNILVGGA